jgi:hypothetical protein
MTRSTKQTTGIAGQDGYGTSLHSGGMTLDRPPPEAKRPGNPNLAKVRPRGTATTKAKADQFARSVEPIIREIQASGVTSHRGIARALVARGVATARSGKWTAMQVGAILRRLMRLAPSRWIRW